MTAILQFRRGTVAAHSTFVGSVAEPTVSTDDARLRIHDGATAGGIPYAKVSELVAQASTGVVGKTRYASTTEAVAAASTATAVTPAGMGQHSAPLAGSKNLTGGFTQTTHTVSSSTSITPSGLNGQLQALTNGYATQINVPAADTKLSILVTNSSNAGTISFSTNYKIGSSAGDALTTANGSIAVIDIWRINGVATYSTTLLTTF